MIKQLSLSTYFRYILAVLTAAALFITAAGLSPATAADDPPPTEIDAAQTATTVNNTTLISETDAGSIGLTLPGQLVGQPQVPLSDVPEEYLEATEETPLVNTTLAHGAISSYETVTGTQTLIRIDSAEAAKEYRFPLSLPEGATAQLIKGGTILVKDAEGKTLGGYDVPWAIDANDAPVPTRFTLDGDTLIQTVDFTPETVFPIIADPIWLAPWVVRCLIGIGLNSGQITNIAARGSIAAMLAAGGYAAVRCVLGR